MAKVLQLASGVDLEKIDDFGLAAQAIAKETDGNIPDEWEVLHETRGESVFCLKTKLGEIVGGVDEGVGTKNLLAGAARLRRHMFKNGLSEETLDQFWFNLGVCTVAMIVNDMITLGVMPRMMMQHVSFAPPFLDDVRGWRQFLLGWKHGCDLSGAVWGGGETAELNGLIVPGQAVLKGSCWGTVPEGCELFDPSTITEGDVVVGVESSGIHANGLTKAREVAARRGYRVELENGQTYVEALLKATLIYRLWVEECMKAGLKIRYFVPITGHGWRKLLRAPALLHFIVDEHNIPAVPPELDFIGETLGYDERTMYGTYNQGLGAAMIVPQEDLGRAILIGADVGLDPWLLSSIGRPPGTTSILEIPSLGIKYEKEVDLKIR